MKESEYLKEVENESVTIYYTTFKALSHVKQGEYVCYQARVQGSMFKDFPIQMNHSKKSNGGSEYLQPSLHCLCMGDKYRCNCWCLILPGVLVLGEPLNIVAWFPFQS